MARITPILLGTVLCLCSVFFVNPAVDNLFAATKKVHPVLNVRLATDATQLDPHYSSGQDVYVFCQIFDSLVKFDGQNQMAVKPSLAKSWESSKDQKIWTFHLIKTKWHDGEEFTADDVVFTVARYKKSPFTIAKSVMLDHAEAVDKHTVKIYLKYAYPHFIRQLASWPWRIVSKKAVEKYGNGKREMVIGTGPYQLKDWKIGEGVTLVSNKNYFEGAPYFETINFKLLADDMTAMVAFERGEIDIVDATEGLDAQMARKNKDYKVLGLKQSGAHILVMNVQKKPLNNKALRQAINYAIDKKSLVQLVFDGEAYPDCDLLLSPGEEGYTTDIKTYEFSLAKARAKIRESGLKPSDLKIKYTYPTTYGGPKMAAAMKESMAAIGIELELVPVELGKFISAMYSGDYEMMAIRQQSIPYNPVLVYNLYYKSNVMLNYSRYKNPAIDALILKANHELNDAKRIGYFEKVTQIIKEEAYYAPIAYIKVNMVTTPHLKGMEWELNTMISKMCDWYWEE